MGEILAQLRLQESPPASRQAQGSGFGWLSVSRRKRSNVMVMSAALHLQNNDRTWPQVAGLQRSLSYGARVPQDIGRSLPACLSIIFRKEGIRGLYKGALPSIIKAAPAAAVTFSAYEAALKALDQVQHVSHDLLA